MALSSVALFSFYNWTDFGRLHIELEKKSWPDLFSGSENSSLAAVRTLVAISPCHCLTHVSNNKAAKKRMGWLLSAKL